MQSRKYVILPVSGPRSTLFALRFDAVQLKIGGVRRVIARRVNGRFLTSKASRIDSDVRILLAEDHDLTRAGLRYLLEKQKDWTVCGEAANGRIAVELAEACAPDIAILDMSMPEMNGVEATRQILKKCSKTKVLIYTMHETERVIVDALDAGASGIVLKSDAGDNMVTAVESIARGRRFFTSHVAETIVEAYLAKKTGTATETESQIALTTREREVIQLLAEGKSNKEVADRLGISTRTAEGHRAEIMKRLKLASLGRVDSLCGSERTHRTMNRNPKGLARNMHMCETDLVRHIPLRYADTQ